MRSLQIATLLLAGVAFTTAPSADAKISANKITANKISANKITANSVAGNRSAAEGAFFGIEKIELRNGALIER